MVNTGATGGIITDVLHFVDRGSWGGTFIFSLDGNQLGRFAEVDGLEVSIDTHDYEEGGTNGFVHTFTGRMKWPNLVFKRGITMFDELYEWIMECSGEEIAKKGKPPRYTGAVSLLDSLGMTVRHWSFENALPVRWHGPRFAATSTDYPEEELEISHDGLRVESVKPFKR
jgi:phage tail-like protein